MKNHNFGVNVIVFQKKKKDCSEIIPYGRIIMSVPLVKVDIGLI